MKIPDDVRYLIGKLKAQGFDAYAVGGCVRDSILNKEPNDWDITTDALPEQMKSCFQGMRLIETGLKHGTLTVMLRGTGYEITTYRIDGAYTDHRRPDSVTFVKDLSMDLERRDFTVNAMACDENGTITDLFDGRADLENRVIRCVGDPHKRFEEDALRILRALRFASVYDFSIDPETARAALDLKDTLLNVSAERIFTELKKLLCGKGAERILLEYPQILFTFLPELKPMEGFAQNNPHHAYDIWTHTAKALSAAPADPVCRLTMLFHDSGKPQTHSVGKDGYDHFKMHPLISADIAESCLLRLKSDTQTMRSVVRMIKDHDLRIPADQKAVKKQLVRLGCQGFMELLPIFRADASAQNPVLIEEKLLHIDALESIASAVIASGACLTLSQLDLSGNDLKALGFTGPAVGETLKKLLEMVSQEDYPNKKALLIEAAKGFIGNAES